MYQLLELIAIVSLGIWSVYALVNLIRLASYKIKKQGNENPVSIIVCAHNELDSLKQLIPELLKQEHPNFELIIVDDRSDDGTYDFLLKAQSDKVKLVKVDKVHDHINAKKYAITLGVKAAKNDILLFTDADCRPASKNWVSSISRAFSSETNFVLGVSQYENKSGFLSSFIRFETMYTAINYIGFALSGNPYMGVGRNMAYRKSFFLENKGFINIQHIAGGDDDLLVNQYATKHNTKVVLGFDSLIFSIPKTSWSSYRIQKTRHWSVGKFYSFKDKFLLGLQNIINLIFWLSFTILATQSSNSIVVASLIVYRMFFVLILNDTASKKFGDQISLWLVPMMDILYVIYTSIFGVIALFTKKVRWRK